MDSFLRKPPRARRLQVELLLLGVEDFVECFALLFALVMWVALFSDFVTVTMSPALRLASDATALPVAVSVVDVPAASFRVMVLAVASVDTTSPWTVDALAAGALAGFASLVAGLPGRPAWRTAPLPVRAWQQWSERLRRRQSPQSRRLREQYSSRFLLEG